MHIQTNLRKSIVVAALAVSISSILPAHAAPSLIAVGTLSNSTDMSGLGGITLENNVDHQNVLGGIGSGLAWAGGSTFIALPDRGPNATAWNSNLADTTSYIARFQTVNLGLTQTPSGGLPFTLTPTLTGTTLLSSPTALNYAAANAQNNNISGVSLLANDATHYYFSGRSDNFSGPGSLNDANARLDTEGVRVSADGTKLYISDEYGPYVYEFNRATGQRTHTFALPSYYGVTTLGPTTTSEVSANTSGRVANKGMEGLAITPDGTKLIGFMQSPLLQDGGDGGRANRIITIDIATGATHEFVYDNQISGVNYNSSEILAVNDHEFLVLERDGKGLGSGNGGSNQTSALKALYKINIQGADDVGALGLSGEANLLPHAVSKSLFLDIKGALVTAGVATNSTVPPKLEGAAWGDDVTYNNTTMHTLYIANDNDFIPGTAGPNKFYVFGVTDADLGGSTFVAQTVPEPGSALLLGAGFLGLVGLRRRA